ncbi:MAG: YlbF family regulator [Spirochaeta sp.]
MIQEMEKTAVDAADALAKQLTAGPTYTAFQAQVDALRADQEALAVLQDFQNEQHTFQQAQHYGGDSRELLEQLQEKERRVTEHPVLSAFFAAQQALIDELAEVNASITANLGYDFAALAKPAGGCCS